MLLAQLLHHHTQHPEKLSALKAKLSDLAHAYCGTPVDVGDFLTHKVCRNAIKSLRSHSDILITKPDKGLGVVILNKFDNITKINSISQDASKFKTLGPATSNGNTSKIESKIQRRLLQLYKGNLLPAAYMMSFDQQDHNDRACMAYQRHTRKMFRFDLFYR